MADNEKFKENQQAQALESAIIQRAQALADEQHELGKRQTERMKADFSSRMQVREERELLAAKSAADREYHRRVQASELQMQAELDRQRWSLVQSVMQQLMESLQQLRNDPSTYHTLLQHDLIKAAQSLQQPMMIVHVIQADYDALASQWDTMTQGIHAVECQLHTLPIEKKCSGGLLCYSEDTRICIDFTFEGKVELMRDELQQAILSRLLPSKMSNEYMSLLFNG